MSLRASLDVSAVPPSPAGAGRYTIEIARALAARDDLDLTLLARRGDLVRWQGMGAEVIAEAPDGRIGRILHERWRMGPRIDRLGVDLHHAPHYTMPRRMRTPAVVTVHDLTFFDRPEVHEATKVRFFTAAIRRAAREAGAIVAVSDRTAAELMAKVEVEVPVVVAPHGIDHGRFRPDEPTPGSDAGRLAGLGVDPSARRVVALGTLEPRKGLLDLVAAFDRLAGEDPDLDLVLVGQRGWGNDELDRSIAGASAGSRIKALGYVDDEVVPALLRSAAVVAYPSIDEGFGLPALEALACGARLVTTQGSVMEEICGPAAWLAPPRSAEGLAASLLDALGADDAEASRRRALGMEVASRHSWAASAERHREAYAIAAEG